MARGGLLRRRRRRPPPRSRSLRDARLRTRPASRGAWRADSAGRRAPGKPQGRGLAGAGRGRSARRRPGLPRTACGRVPREPTASPALTEAPPGGRREVR